MRGGAEGSYSQEPLHAGSSIYRHLMAAAGRARAPGEQRRAHLGVLLHALGAAVRAAGGVAGRQDGRACGHLCSQAPFRHAHL